MLPWQAPHAHSNRGVVLVKWKEALCSVDGDVQYGEEVDELTQIA